MSNVVSNVKTYVNDNFTKEEKTVFNFIIESFPEYLLVDNLGNNNEDILALLALIAKAIGSSRELINNLATAHSVQELYDKIDDEKLEYLRENNLELLLLLIEDLNVPLFRNKTRDEKIALLEDKGIRDLVINSYLLTRDRGTKTAIKNIIDLTLKNLLHSTEIVNTEDVLRIIEDKGQSLIYLKSDESITENGTTVYPIEELIDFSLSNHEPLEFFIDGEFIDNVFYLKTDNPMYQTIMAYKPSGIIYNAVVKYLSHNLFMNKASDFVITKDNQSLVYHDIELKAISKPELLTKTDGNNKWIFQGKDDSNEFTYQLEFENTNKYAPLRLVIDDSVTSGQHKMILKPSESKIITVDFSIPSFDTFSKIYVSYWFENIGNEDEIKSIVVDLEGTKYNVAVANLVSPELEDNDDGSIKISNTNITDVSIEINETWTLYGKVYGTTVKHIDNIYSYSNYTYKPINISSKHRLDVTLSVMFKLGHITSDVASITLENIEPIEGITPPILDTIDLDTAPSVSVVDLHGNGYIPHMSITNSNPNFVDCEITYSYYGELNKNLIKTETYNLPSPLPPDTTTNNIPLKPCPLPYNNEKFVVLTYSVTFKHENSNIETSTIHNDMTGPSAIIFKSLPTSPERLRPYNLELVKGSGGYGIDSTGFIDAKVTLFESLPSDTNIYESFVEFKIQWYDSATSEFLSEQIELVNTPTTTGGKSYKKWIANRYNRTTNAKVYVRAFTRFTDSKQIMVQSETINDEVNNITNNYGGI